MPSRPQKIYYDVTQLAHWSGKITGIPRVVDELAKRFYKQADREVAFVSWVKDIGQLCEIDFDQTIQQRNGVVYKKNEKDEGPSAVTKTVQTRATPNYVRLAKKVAKKGLALSGAVSPRVAAKFEKHARHIQADGYKKVDFQKGDILFIPWGEWWDTNFTDYVVACHGRGAKIVQIIHDIGTTTQPQFFEQVAVSPTVYNSRVLPIADLVLANSLNTKKELEEWLGSNKLRIPPIQVFRLGDGLEVAKSQKPTDKQFVRSKLQGGDYLLCVGTIESKKNHQLFYYVYKLAKARGIILPKIVIVGRLGWHTEVVYDIMTHDPEVKDSFVFLHNTSDEELSWLYDHCLFTVLPSFHEGWGIPIAESVARGVPCLCSNTSSMVEIAEGIVDHFSPASTDECLAGIQRLLDPEYLQAARNKTKKYKPHGWDGSFKQVQTYLEEITQ
jgi:glycosyltransferase involved in cell wall biosynthesis